jgi:DNA-directed RNA polymerase subunit RPC12/RpoP
MTPHLYKCPKCGYEFKWSEHHDFMNLGRPYCHECYHRMLSSHVPLADKVK